MSVQNILKSVSVYSVLIGIGMVSSASLAADWDSQTHRTAFSKKAQNEYQPQAEYVSAPSLIVTDGQAPKVIYKHGSRDILLEESIVAEPAPTKRSILSLSNFSSKSRSFAKTRSSGKVPTLVGRKVSDLSVDLRQLREDVNAKSARLLRLMSDSDQIAHAYYALVAGMSATLQSGTTAGNPDLVDQWNYAQKNLNTLAEGFGELANLTSQIDSDASKAAFLLESTRATFSLSGAREQDHEHLIALEDDINQTIVRIDRLLNQVSDETNRRTTYLRSERLNMQTLSYAIANGNLYGQNISNRLFTRAAQAAAGKADVGPVSTSSNGLISGRRPLVVIRFDRADLEYEQALFGALSQALERRPDAQFDLVAVSPNSGNAAELALHTTAARKNGEAVLRSVTQMGVPLERVNLNAANSDTALNSEVHIYVR